MFRRTLTRSAHRRLTYSRGIICSCASQPAWAVSRKASRVTARGLANGGALSARWLGACGTTGLPLENDTVYALSSAPGRGGIAVIRISGPGCLDVSAPNARAKTLALTGGWRYILGYVPASRHQNLGEL